MLTKKEQILLNGGNLWYFGEGLLGPLFAVFAERVGGDVLEITWAWAVYLAIGGVFTIIFGKFSDTYVSKEKMMIAGYALNAACSFAYLFVINPFTLLLVQVGLGLANALATPTWEALYAKYEKRSEAGSSWGLAEGQAQLMLAVAAVIGGFVVVKFSFSALFILMGSAQVVATIYQAKILQK